MKDSHAEQELERVGATKLILLRVIPTRATLAWLPSPRYIHISLSMIYIYIYSFFFRSMTADSKIEKGWWSETLVVCSLDEVSETVKCGEGFRGAMPQTGAA